MKRLFALAAILILLFSGCGHHEIVADEPAPTPELSRYIIASQRESARSGGLPRFVSDRHEPYMTALQDRWFYPDRTVTRGEACRALYALLENPVPGGCSFSDLKASDALYPAVSALTAWGVISDSDGAFNADGLISRAQLLTMLSRFCPAKPETELKTPQLGSFLHRWTDIDRLSPETVPNKTASFTDIAGHWAENAIENAVERGWIEAGGKFYPDAAVTRAEFCHYINCAAGRHCDEAVTLLTDDYTAFSDVPVGHPYYADIMEAGRAHEFTVDENGIELWACEPLEPGFHRVGGHLYCVKDDGTLRRNEDYKQWHFDETGRYTTGVPTADAALQSVLLELGTDDMTQAQALRAAYLYCTYDHVYIYHDWYSYGFVDYDNDQFPLRALKFIETGGGQCYDYAAAFGLLARSLGYDCYIVKAQINQFYAPHGWVVIPENGVNYIYDTEMESTRPWRHADFDLFRITNHSIYNYWYTPYW